MVFSDVGVGDGATVGVGVDQQHLPAGGGRLEGQVDGDGGAPRAALGPPDGGQGPPPVAVRLGRDLAGRWRFVAGVGFGGQRGPGPVDQAVRRVGVGGDVQEPELAEPALAVLVTGRRHADHGQPGGGQPGQGVTVQPPGSGGDHRHLGLASGGHGEQVAQVVAPVQHLGPDLPRQAGLDQRRLPGRPHPAVTNRVFTSAPPWSPHRPAPGSDVAQLHARRGVGRGLRGATWRRRRGGGLVGGLTRGLDHEDPGGGDGGGHHGSTVAWHAELDAAILPGAGEPGRVLEDLDDLGGWQQDDRPAPAGALGVGGQHLHAVAGPQALRHVSRVDLDRHGGSAWTGSTLRGDGAASAEDA